MLPVALMALAMLISYQRAKAESLGYDAKGGLMERAERFIVLGFGLLFSELLIGVLWVMFVLSAITAGQRFVKVWRQARARPSGKQRQLQPAASRTARVAARRACDRTLRARTSASSATAHPRRAIVNVHRASGESFSASSRPMRRRATLSPRGPIVDHLACVGSPSVPRPRRGATAAPDRRAQPASGARPRAARTRAAADVARGLRLVRPLLRRQLPPAAVAPQTRSKPAFTIDGYRPHRGGTRPRPAIGPILALPHLGGWEWAAFWLTRITGSAVCSAVVEELGPPSCSNGSATCARIARA